MKYCDKQNQLIAMQKWYMCNFVDIQYSLFFYSIIGSNVEQGQNASNAPRMHLVPDIVIAVFTYE